ncbi:hypothetical protein DXG03_000626, partial [Asterophora parasitica]
MASTLTSLPSDLLSLISRHVWLTFDPDEALDASRNDNLMALSSTCSRLRAITLPFLFRYAYNCPSFRAYNSDRDTYFNFAGRRAEWNKLWPSNVWPHIRNLTVYGSVEYYPSLVVSSIEPILPHLHNLNRLCLHLATPLRSVLLALSELPFLHTLEIHGARVDGPPLLEAFLQLRNLASLTVTVDEISAKDLNYDDELKNVADILTVLAPKLSRLEIAGDLIDLGALAALEWPRLHSLRLLNHIPEGIHVPLSALVRRMPSLRILECDFSAGIQPSGYYDSIIFGDDTPRPDISLPNLSHLSISNVQPNDNIIHQLPRSLEI